MVPLLSQAQGQHCAGTALWSLAAVASLRGAPGNVKYKATDFLLVQGVVTQRSTRTCESTKLTVFALLFVELGSHVSHCHPPAYWVADDDLGLSVPLLFL